MADELFDVRNALTVGNFHQAIADGSTARTMSKRQDDISAFATERDAAVAMAQIGLGQSEAVLMQLRSATSPLLLSIRKWAELVTALRVESSSSSRVVAAVEQLESEAEVVDADTIFRGIYGCAALLFVQESAKAVTLGKKWLAALPPPQTALAKRRVIELHGVVVEALLQLHRPDEAAKEVRAMQKVDEECISTLLYEGIVALHEAAVEVKADVYLRALTSLKEVAMRCGRSVMVLNLMALAQMGLKQFEDAERSLLDALAVRSGDEATTVNLAVVSGHRGSASTSSASHFLTEAATVNTPWGSAYRKKAAELDDAIASFVATTT